MGMARRITVTRSCLPARQDRLQPCYDTCRPHRGARLATSCHATRQSRRANILRGGGFSALQGLAGRVLSPLRRRLLGLLSDAQSRPPHPDPLGRAGIGLGAFAGASDPCRVRQRASAPNGTSVSGAVRFGRRGRGASDGDGALRRLEPSEGASGESEAIVAAFERTRASCRTRRRSRTRASAARSRAALRRSARNRPRRSRFRRGAPQRIDWPPARRRGLPRCDRPAARPRRHARQARAQAAKRESNTGVSP
jgi:hypothetical protein